MSVIIFILLPAYSVQNVQFRWILFQATPPSIVIEIYDQDKVNIKENARKDLWDLLYLFLPF